MTGFYKHDMWALGEREEMEMCLEVGLGISGWHIGDGHRERRMTFSTRRLVEPPLVIDEEQVRTGLRLLEEACRRVAAEGTEPFRPILGDLEAGPGEAEGT